MATIYRKLSSGASYDQSKSTKALNYFEDYLILFPNIPLVERMRLRVNLTNVDKNLM